MTSKITLIVAVLLSAFSSMAIVGTANATPRSSAEQASQSEAWAAPASADAADAADAHR